MNTKPESFREKFFSFQGRLGRERTAILSIWLCALGIIPILSISAVSLSDSQILVFVSCLVFFIHFIISGLSLMTRRFHDLGHSGWLYLVFIVIATLAGLVVYILKTMTVFYIISFPATILGLYLWVWPGQFQENKYGMPPRGMDRKFQDQKEKFEKEFFSFKGRVGRKWFIFITIFAFFEISTTYSIIEHGMIFLALPETHRVIVGESILGLVVLMLLYLPLLFVLLRGYSSLVVRRVQDLGWPTALAAVPIGLRIISLSIPVFLITNASTRELVGYLVGKSSFAKPGAVMIMLVEVIVLLVLAIQKGESGSNKFGENPVFYSDVFPVQALSPEDPAGEMER